jgi:asparagine synthase (glutamine-hydrolysing)
MCGIAGIFSTQPLQESQLLEKMAASLNHRGPDNQTVYQWRHAGLVHTRLSVIDLEGGNQPIHHDNDRLSLVANGEIYNYIELEKKYKSTGARYSTHSDCESILHAYVLDPDKFPISLNGMFAFALLDKKKNSLILCRDRLGIKPLYYTRQGNSILFASEIRTLIPCLKNTPSINNQALAEYLQTQFSSGRQTIINDIYRVLPGERIIFNNKLEADHHIYWSANSVETQSITLEEAEEQFEALFLQVMKEHIRSDVPFGLFLSGGADSAILLAMLSELHSLPIDTYSIGFKDSKLKSELADAEFIATQFGSTHHAIQLDQEDIYSHIPRMCWAFDDLMRDYATIPTSILSEHASAQLKVVFSGEGGDEAFSGYRRYHAGRMESSLKNLFSPGSGGYRVRGQLTSYSSLLNPEIMRSTDWRLGIKTAWSSCSDSYSLMQHRQCTDIKTALPDNLLNKADRCMMGFGLEGRVPFVDHRVIEFGLSLPDHLKRHQRSGKYLLKKWAERRIPADYLYRKKRGFYVPISEVLNAQRLANIKSALVGHSAIKEYFNIVTLNKLFEQQMAGKNHIREIFSVMQFAIWHNIFLNNLTGTPSSVEDPVDWIRSS